MQYKYNTNTIEIQIVAPIYFSVKMQLSDQWLDRMLAINTAGDQKVCRSKQESWKSWLRVTWILHPSVFWAFIYLFLYISISRLFGQRASDGAAVFPIPVFFAAAAASGRRGTLVSLVNGCRMQIDMTNMSKYKKTSKYKYSSSGHKWTSYPSIFCHRMHIYLITVFDKTNTNTIEIQGTNTA